MKRAPSIIVITYVQVGERKGTMPTISLAPVYIPVCDTRTYVERNIYIRQGSQLKRAYELGRLYFMGTYLPNIGGSKFELALQIILNFFSVCLSWI